jgi:hypothetical protein
MQGVLKRTLTLSAPAPTVSITLTGSGIVYKDVTTALAFAGTIASGTVTAAGHDITTGKLVAVFWTDANGVSRRRYGITAGTVSGNAIPVGSGGGSGDALPSTGAVTICAATILTGSTTPAIPALTGSQMLQFLVQCSQWGALDFFSDAGTTNILHVDATAAGEGTDWSQNDPAARPFSAALAQINAYNASAKTAATWSIRALLV